MEDGLQLFHKWLLAEQPSYSHRGEETKTLTLGKVLRSVVTEVELSHIAVVIGGRQATGNTLLTIVLETTIVVGLLVVEQHGIHIGFTKTMVIHQVGLEIHAGITIFIALLVAQRFIASFMLRVNQVTLFITSSSGEYGTWFSRTTTTATVPAVETKQTLSLQSWQNHLQILLNTEQSLNFT